MQRRRTGIARCKPGGLAAYRVVPADQGRCRACHEPATEPCSPAPAPWYVLEFSPVAPDLTPRLCFGLVDGHDKELGHCSLDELEQVRGPLGPRIERDLWFIACPLSPVRGREGWL